jgi:hypothetical protein
VSQVWSKIAGATDRLWPTDEGSGHEWSAPTVQRLVDRTHKVGLPGTTLVDRPFHSEHPPRRPTQEENSHKHSMKEHRNMIITDLVGERE